MIDTSTTRGKIVDAALRLAGTKGWRELTLQDIAAEAGVPLAEIRHHFRSKNHILTAFTRLIDDAVLSTLQASDAGAGTRDRLFDVLMTRFEVMAPYKAGLKSALATLRNSPASALSNLVPALQSQYWMLAAAGVSGEGWRGRLRVNGLAAIYASTLDVWFADDDPSMAKTMAALDKKLRRADSAVKRVDTVCDSGEEFLESGRRLLKSLCGLPRACKEQAPPVKPEPESAGGTAPEAPVPAHV